MPIPQINKERTDTDRLNWIEQLDFPGSHIWKAKFPEECGFSWLVCNSVKGNTLREAIDTAMDVQFNEGKKSV